MALNKVDGLVGASPSSVGRGSIFILPWKAFARKRVWTAAYSCPLPLLLSTVIAVSVSVVSERKKSFGKRDDPVLCSLHSSFVISNSFSRTQQRQTSSPYLLRVSRSLSCGGGSNAPLLSSPSFLLPSACCLFCPSPRECPDNIDMYVCVPYRHLAGCLFVSGVGRRRIGSSSSRLRSEAAGRPPGSVRVVWRLLRVSSLLGVVGYQRAVVCSFGCGSFCLSSSVSLGRPALSLSP